MTKSRTQIPAKTRDSVLKEFRHRCAMCGGEAPQLHHIDEKPNNNEPSNLLPLCPNCHLRDQHDPTASIEIEKLKLFRKFKDPTILKTQFHPLFKRMKFLYELDSNSNFFYLSSKSNELIEFVASLKMGDFYTKRISALMDPPRHVYERYRTCEPDPGNEKFKEKRRQEYIEQLGKVRAAVEELIVELLRYQEWK